VLGGGFSSAMMGGDFWMGAQTGAMQYLFNRMGEGIVDAGMQMVNNGLGMLSNTVQKIPDPVYDVASITLGVAEVAAYGTGVGAVPIVATNLALNSASLYKTYKQHGVYSRQFVINAAATAGGPFFSKGVGLVVNRATLIYNNMNR
jgi:hypothetical protein